MTSPYQPFPIFAFTTSLDKDVQPWILPIDAFQTILDGYVHHGVLNKRSGTKFFGDFVNASTLTLVSISNTNPNVAQASAPIAAGTYIQIRNATGMTEINNTTYKAINPLLNFFNLADEAGNIIDTTSFGVYTGGGEIFVVPANPIMGIKQFIDTNNALQTLIWDTKRACIYDTGTQLFDPLDTADIFNATPSSFVSVGNYGKTSSFSTSTLYFSNFTGDTGLPISPVFQYTTGATTSQFTPDTTPTAVTRNYIVAAQFIFSIRQRLLLLNTIESTSLPAGSPPVSSGTHFPQRMRWSQAQDPNTFDEITPGAGGFDDAATSDSIITAKQLEDIIVVQFTYSMWLIKPNSDPAQPFKWYKLNSFRASEAPYASIGHDRFIINYGRRGITATDSVEVQRMDDKIQLFMQEEINADFIERMYSERNYTERRSWTLYPASVDDKDPDSDSEPETSNRALIRTEEEGAWSIYRVALISRDETGYTNMSCLGFGETQQDLAFDDFESETFDSFSSETFQSFFIQSNSEILLGGDQEGRVLFLEKDGDDLEQDIGFEVISAGWNPYKEQGIQAQLGYVDFYVDADQSTFFTVEFYCDDIDTPYASQNLDCLPPLGYLADIQTISLTNPVQVTAASNGLTTGQQIYIYNLVGADQLMGGPYTVTVVNENQFTLDGIDGTSMATYISGGMIVERPFNNSKCWKRAYAGAKGYLHYIRIVNSGKDDVLRFNAFMPWFRPAGRRMIGA